MNSFGATIRYLNSLTSEADRRLVLTRYLASLSREDLEAVLVFLTRPSMTKRTQLRSLRRLAEGHTGERLFTLSHAFTGDLAETISLLWPQQPGANRPVSPAELREALKLTGPLDVHARLPAWLSGCDPAGRHAIIRIVTGTLRDPVPQETLLAVLEERGLPPPPSRQQAPPATQADLFAPPQAASIPPGEIDAVLLYVEQDRSVSSAIMCTFGAWLNDELVPVARLAAGAFQAEIAAHASRHTIRRFGPTREISREPGTALLATITYGGMEAASRRKAGLVLTSPQLASVTKPAAASDADDLDLLTSRLPAQPPHD